MKGREEWGGSERKQRRAGFGGDYCDSHEILNLVVAPRTRGTIDLKHLSFSSKLTVGLLIPRSSTQLVS